jgi:F-type H+-transporting ATPase subunit gamma
MFSRRAFQGVAPAVSNLAGLNAAKGAAQLEQTRQVSLKAVSARMKSVKSMQKITKAMKMVAAAKMKGDQRRMEAGMPFVKPVQALFSRLPNEEKSGTVTFLALTSDKGLCGAINSSVSKMARLGIQQEEAKGNTAKVMVVGNKGAGALKRIFGDRFTISFEEVVKIPWSFATASNIAERVIAANPQRLNLVTNTFKSLVTYVTVSQHIVTVDEAQTMDKAEFSKAMDVYSFEPALYEVWNDLHDFYYGAVIYGAYLEGATSEQSARMAAMENASKNAGEMFGKLELIYNRARQAKITTELCEIISGASAV